MKLDDLKKKTKKGTYEGQFKIPMKPFFLKN